MRSNLVMAQTGYIGIDVGGTKTLFALFDRKLKLVEETKVKTQECGDLREFLAVKRSLFSRGQ